MKTFSNPIVKKEEKKGARSSPKTDSLREIIAGVNFDAPCFPKFYGMAFKENNSNLPILFSSHARGQKLQKLSKELIEDNPEKISDILMEIASAIAFIHQKQMYHGDLTPNNILVDFNENTDKLAITLIDFGMCGNIEKDHITGFTVEFAAYEIFTRKFIGLPISKIDIFAFGSIMFQMYYRLSFPAFLVKLKKRKNKDYKVWKNSEYSLSLFLTLSNNFL